MTLRRRMILHIGVTVAGVAALGAGVAAGVRGLRQDFGVALQANRQLRQVYEVGVHVASAKRWLNEERPDPGRALEEVRRAELTLGRSDYGMDERGGGGERVPPGWLRESEIDVARVRSSLRDAATQLKGSSASPPGGPARPAEAAALDETLAALAALSSQTRTTIARRQEAADAKHRATLAAVVGLSAVIIAGAAVAGFRLYRSVISPLERLGETVRRIAAGRREERAAMAGDEEFVALARDFNRMAGELDGLCRELERRVETKSRELVRSERLASVGYLAAGVAHEINNPLGIIAGYGERSLQHLRRGLDAATAGRVQKAIEVMCEEAFRCKGITDRLLSLARPGAESRARVSLAAVAHEVVSNVGGLADFADRRITLEADAGAEAAGALRVLGRDAELKQVVLNLLVNALDAVSPRDGRVWVTVRRGGGDHIELQVRDNGRGIAPDTLERVFEPFFSDRRGGGPGTGLGLSITHAIVAEHGGTVRAESGGAGSGSCFTVRLPAAREEVSAGARR